MSDTEKQMQFRAISRIIKREQIVIGDDGAVPRS
jgi:hypothetical protein